MYLSKRTIDYHVRNVFMKLGIASRTELGGIQLADETPVKEEAASLA